MRRCLVVSWMILLAGWILGWSTAAHALSTGFIENRGQVNEAVRYYVPGAGGTVYVTPQAVVMDLKDHVARPAAGRDTRADPLDPMAGDSSSVPQTQRGCAVYIRFEGADPSPTVEARQQLETQYNFCLGSDPARWRSEVPAYAEVVYREVWPGIDLVFREDGGALAYEALVRSGADAGVLAFTYEGAEGVRPEGSGLERVETSVGSLVHERGGLSGQFRWVEPGRGVAVDSGPMLLDNPAALLWSTFLGGSSDELGHAMALDPSGNPTVTGCTESSDFPTTPGAYDRSHNGDNDIFIAKISSLGSALLWSTFLGGSDHDVGFGLALDSAGNPVVTGQTRSSNFPTTPGAYDRGYNGLVDAFVAKLSFWGGELLWSTFLGGDHTEAGNALALDPLGSTVVTGSTYSSDFPTTPGAYDGSFNDSTDVFVTKLSSSGSALLWSTFLGGSYQDGAVALALDPSANPVVTGGTRSPDFPTTPWAFDRSYNDLGDAFVAQLSSSGSTLLWSTFLGGICADWGIALALDASGNPVVAGYTESAGFPATFGAYDRYWNGGEDVFVTKVSSSGSAVLWSTFLGGSSDDGVCALALDPSGNPVVTGWTYSSNFPTTPRAYDGSFNDSSDVFIAQLSSSGSAVLWSTFLGGSDYDWGYGLALDASGNPVVAGWTESASFPTTPGAYDRSYNGGSQDVFVAKLEAIAMRTDVGFAPEGASASSLQSAPNPTTRVSTLRLTADKPGRVMVRISDSTGRLIRTLPDTFVQAGTHDVTWDGRDDRGALVKSGLYFYQVSIGEQTHTGKLVVAR